MKNFKFKISVKVIIAAVVLLAAVSGGIFAVRHAKGTNPFSDDNSNVSFSELWEARQYKELIEYGNNELRRNPMNKNALIFTGFANFYQGISILIPEERAAYMEESIKLLRKALLSEGEVNASVKYILGKAYYHKGIHYSNLSVKYLSEALNEKQDARDIYEYLGLSYARMGDREKSIENFEKAVALNPSSPLLILSLANAYLENRETEAAARVLNSMGDIEDNEDITEKKYLLAGRVNHELGNSEQAEACLKKAIEINSSLVDAHYYLGLVYEARGEKRKAERQWRTGYRINPDYLPIKNRLYR